MSNKMSDEEDLESLMSHIGEFGSYQWRQFLLLILGATTAGLHMLSVVTVAAVPEHRCAIPDLDENSTNYFDNSDLFALWIPTLSNGNQDPCHYIDYNTNETESCSKWMYDTTYYKSSRGMEWNFVCANRWKSAVTQSSYMFGVFTGAVTLGSMADKYGRKIIFYISAIFQLLFGVGVAFVPEFYSYLVVMFFYGLFGSAGSYITGFVIAMEIVGPSKRTAVGLTFQGMFALGVMLVALWGALIPDRVILQVVYGLHSLMLVGHWWLIDESPRWLWSQGRYLEAVTIIEKAIKINGGVDTELDKTKFLSGRKYANVNQEQQTYSVLDMFRTPKLRLKSLNTGLNWFANSLVYYGLSLNAGKLFGNPYLVLFILGLVEIPSYFVSTALLDRTGRRCLTSTFMLLGGLACMAAALIPRVSDLGSMLATAVVFFGKFCISASFAIIYNYSAELFPTVIRNTAMGVGSMCARFSATLTPLISLMDSFDPRVPTVVFATVALVSGALTLLLPETMNKPMPQSLDDGENFGEGDTCCSTGCFGKKTSGTSVPMQDLTPL
ncbi:organic cation transporter protein [Nilaparvata lugens]|uniref:organic cation transporter protein n=1 Tax=Nilaparvata lugens TaxID=108931 RepID=UPI00193E63D9|nr:organic cation transporter protein [Nilaparvata lugens]